MAVLNQLFGVAWIPMAVVMAIGLVDTLAGGWLFYRVVDVLDLDCYTTLSEKYRDKERDVFREERHFAYDNYSQYLRQILQARDFAYARQFRHIKKAHDYLTLYYMELAWDGDTAAKNWIKKEWEE